MNEYPYRAFSGYGLELEYMIVDATTLNVSPIADRVLGALGPAEDMDVVRNTPQQFDAVRAAMLVKWSKIIKQTGIQAD